MATAAHLLTPLSQLSPAVADRVIMVRPNNAPCFRICLSARALLSAASRSSSLLTKSTQPDTKVYFQEQCLFGRPDSLKDNLASDSRWSAFGLTRM